MQECAECGSTQLKRISGGVRCGKCGRIVQDPKKARLFALDKVESIAAQKGLEESMRHEADGYAAGYGRGIDG